MSHLQNKQVTDPELMHESNISDENTAGKNQHRQSVFKKSERKLIQLSWENIVIKSVPPKKRCSREP